MTADDRLLIAAGSELAAYRRDGLREHLMTALDDKFRTAPAAGDNGGLFIAGYRRLYRMY